MIVGLLLILCLLAGSLTVVGGQRLWRLMRERDRLAVGSSRMRVVIAPRQRTASLVDQKKVDADIKALREARVRALISEVKALSPNQPSREDRALDNTIGNPYPELMGDPEYDRQVMALARSMAQRHLEYYIRLGLSADKVEAVEQKLVERFMAVYDREAALKQSGLADADRKFGKPMEFHEEATINAEIKALTGVDAGEVRRVLNDPYYQGGARFAELVQARLSYSEEPLTGGQAARIAELIKSYYHAQDGGSYDAEKTSMEIAGGRLAALSSTFYDRLSEFMSPAQIQNLRDVQAERVAAKRISGLEKVQKQK